MRLRTDVYPILLLAAACPALAEERLPIIDMHLHARTSLSEAPATRPCYPPPCQGAPRVSVSDEDPLRLTLEAMERYNIVLGFLSDPLDDVFKWVDAAPRRFLASPFLCEPSDLDLAELRRQYEAGRLGGLGEVGSQYCGLAIDDPKLEPYFAMAAEFDVPVLVHSHGTGAPSERFRISIGRPTRIEEVLVRHPTLRVYIEDSGFPFFEDTVALMYRYPNVYGDLSNITWMKPRTMFYRYLRGLMEAGLGKRLMFGSDQMQWPEVIGEAIEAIESAPFLSEDEKRDILYNNAARFLRLTEREIAGHHGR